MSKKELAAQAALEEEAAANAAKIAAEEAVAQATRDEAARVHAEQVARETETAHLRAQLAEQQEMTRLREVEASKTPMDLRREGWAAASALTLEKKETAKAINMDKMIEYRKERDAKRDADRALEKEEKKKAKADADEIKEAKKQEIKVEETQVKLDEKVETTLAKGLEKYDNYIVSTCAEEIADSETLKNAPQTLVNYFCSPNRISHPTSPYYRSVSDEHKFAVKGALENANLSISGYYNDLCEQEQRAMDIAKIQKIPFKGLDFKKNAANSIVAIKTRRGKQQLIHPSKFHPSIKVKPWMPVLTPSKFSYDYAPYECFYNKETLKVYDYAKTCEIGYFKEIFYKSIGYSFTSYDMVFTANKSVLQSCGIEVAYEDIERPVIPPFVERSFDSLMRCSMGFMEFEAERLLDEERKKADASDKNRPLILQMQMQGASNCEISEALQALSNK